MLRESGSVLRMDRKPGMSLATAPPQICESVRKPRDKRMNNHTCLVRTEMARIDRFAHENTEPHRDPDGECASSFSINFVDRPGFTIRFGRQPIDSVEGSIFIARPGTAYRCHHTEEFPNDVCLSISYQMAEDEMHDFLGREMEFWRPAVLSPSLRSRFFRYMLGRRLAEGDLLGVEEAVLALPMALSTDPTSDDSRSSLRSLWHAERIDAARQVLRRHPEQEHSLYRLARSVGVSPFHFARLFSKLAGISPHRYLIQNRLNLAKTLLADGLSVTEACYAVGFNNLSHFIRSFQRHFRILPSAVRLLAEKSKKMQVRDDRAPIC